MKAWSSLGLRRLAVLVLATALVVAPGAAGAQTAGLVTADLTGDLEPEALAAGVTGEGVAVSNVSYTGAETAAGTFSGGDGIIGFGSGLVLSSGDIADVAGPNTDDSTSTSHGTAGDADLDALASADGMPRATEDAAVLEFDFVPDRDQVFFDYVFASEEYDEFVDSSFNDVFGFFVNGTNCALYNGDPVSVNTINNGDPDRFDIPVSNPEAFVPNERDAAGNAPLDTEMDGLTIVLQCAADVNAGETNRMKLAIADTSDTIYDAAVFIRAGSLTTEPPPPEGPADRVAGATRVETAVEVSRLEFESATTVVLAREDTYPDALAGAPLARMEDAPILLTTTGGLHPAAAAEIDRLGATRAILLGGTAALDEQVEGDLQAMDVAAERIGGGNRFGTAQMIAESLTVQTGTPTAYVTEGEHADPARGWPDALAVSALAAFEGRPILLVNQGRLPGETAQAIADSEAAAIVVVGGLGAVSQEVEDAIAALGPETERTAGLTRYETARAIADRGIAAGMDPAISVLVSGEVFADALVAGPAVAKEGGVMMLSAQPTLDNSPPTRAYLEEFASAVETLYVIGGPVAISDEVVAEANAILAGG